MRTFCGVYHLVLAQRKGYFPYPKDFPARGKMYFSRERRDLRSFISIREIRYSMYGETKLISRLLLKVCTTNERTRDKYFLKFELKFSQIVTKINSPICATETKRAKQNHIGDDPFEARESKLSSIFRNVHVRRSPLQRLSLEKDQRIVGILYPRRRAARPS